MVARYSHSAGRYERYVKPAIDRCGAGVLLLLLLPAFVVLAAAVWSSLGGPVLIRQERVGKDGRTFGMYKFRTMHADRRQSALQRRWDGQERRTCHKRPDDPRLVPVGRFLRRWSLDEVPQLVNVLTGDMSLVGPRPELTSVVEQHYQPWHHDRHQVKPGVTGLWQVTARGQGLMHHHIALDLEYLRDLSLRHDVSILLRTLPSALGRHRGM